MPKKFITSTIIAALAAASMASPALAETTIDGATYWELDDLISTSDESLWRDFMITALNPNDSTVRVIYLANHHDPFAEPLSRLRLFWYQDHEPIYSIVPNQLDADTYAKVFYDAAEGSAEFAELISGNEVEIELPEEFFTTASSPTIYFMPEYGIGYSYGMRYFPDCIALEEGKECRVLMDNNANLWYMPLDVIAAPEEPVAQEEPVTPEKPVVSEESPAPEESTPSSETPVLIKYIYRTITVPATTDSVREEDDQIVVTTPEPAYPLAGNSVDQYNADGDYFEFPWWILALIAAGIVTFSWFFAKKPKKV